MVTIIIIQRFELSGETEVDRDLSKVRHPEPCKNMPGVGGRRESPVWPRGADAGRERQTDTQTNCKLSCSVEAARHKDHILLDSVCIKRPEQANL